MLWILRVILFAGILFQNEGNVEGGKGDIYVLADSIQLECSLQDNRIAIEVTNYSTRAIIFDTLFWEGSSFTFECKDTTIKAAYFGNVPEYEAGFHKTNRPSCILQSKQSMKVIREVEPQFDSQVYFDFFYGILGIPNKELSIHSSDSVLNLLSTNWITTANFICERE